MRLSKICTRYIYVYWVRARVSLGRASRASAMAGGNLHICTYPKRRFTSAPALIIASANIAYARFHILFNDEYAYIYACVSVYDVYARFLDVRSVFPEYTRRVDVSARKCVQADGMRRVSLSVIVSEQFFCNDSTQRAGRQSAPLK